MIVNPTSNVKKQGSLVAGIGALVAIVAFLALPYFKLTVTVADNRFSGYSQAHNVSMTVGTGYISMLAGLIWIDALLAIAVLVLAALLLLRGTPVEASTTPVEIRVRRIGYAVIILGIAGIVYHFLFAYIIGAAQMYNTFQSITTDTNNIADQMARSNISVSASMENAIGAWIYLLGMGTTIVGGVLMLQAGSRQAVVHPQGWPQYAQYAQPYQPQQPQPQAWQQPSQPIPQQVWQQPSQPIPQQVWQQPSQPIPQQMWQQTQQAQAPQSEQRLQPPS